MLATWNNENRVGCPKLLYKMWREGVGANLSSNFLIRQSKGNCEKLLYSGQIH